MGFFHFQNSDNKPASFISKPVDRFIHNARLMPKQLTYTVDEEDGVFIARCIELDIASDGLTKEEAIENLTGALDCYFANPDVRLDQHPANDQDDE